MNPREQFNRKLLVEGKDDQHVIYALRPLQNIPTAFDVIDCNGITNLFDEIPIRLKQPDIEIIGIIIDADADLNVRWQRISTILSGEGFVVPDNINNNGLQLTHPVSNIKFGIWIMPDNNINGMLEDFMRSLIPENDDLLPIANNVLNGIEKSNFNRYSSIHKSKALIHTWLAWQEQPGKPLGQSITMKYLHTDNETCTRFAEWLTTTFSD